MSKKRSQRRSSASTPRRQSPRNAPLLPVIVGVVVIILITAAVISIETRRSAVGVTSGGAAATPQALATASMPFPDVPRVSVEEAKDKLEQGRALLIDVRSAQSFESSHASGAVSIPEAEMDSRLGGLPRDKDLILYCT